MLRRSVDGSLRLSGPPAFRGVRWLSTDDVEDGDYGAWWREVLPRRPDGCAHLRRAGLRPLRRLLPGRRRRHRDAVHGRALPGRSERGRQTTGPRRRRLRKVGGGGGRRDRRAEGTAAQGRERAAVRRGHHQRTQDLVARRRAAPRCLRRAGCRTGTCRRADHRLPHRTRHHPDRATRTPGAGTCRATRGSRDPHYTSRAGDPHRHLHLQVNARVFAAGRWRGLHSVGCAT